MDVEQLQMEGLRQFVEGSAGVTRSAFAVGSSQSDVEFALRCTLLGLTVNDLDCRDREEGVARCLDLAPEPLDIDSVLLLAGDALRSANNPLVHEILTILGRNEPKFARTVALARTFDSSPMTVAGALEEVAKQNLPLAILRGSQILRGADELMAETIFTNLTHHAPETHAALWTLVNRDPAEFSPGSRRMAEIFEPLGSNLSAQVQTAICRSNDFVGEVAAMETDLGFFDPDVQLGDGFLDRLARDPHLATIFCASAVLEQNPRIWKRCEELLDKLSRNS